MNQTIDPPGYRYKGSALNATHAYLLPAVSAEVDRVAADLHGRPMRLFDLGCGNGSTAATFSRCGWEVTVVAPSPEGIANAEFAYPDLRLEAGPAYDDLTEQYGRIPVVVSLEVVEQFYDPRSYAQTLYDLLEPGGTAILPTSYYGNLKNLVPVPSGKLDRHFTALWDHGHIELWSVRTLTQLLNKVGFTVLRFLCVGRIPPLAKSMVAVATKPL